MVAERTIIPANPFDLSVASSSAVANSAPAEAGRRPEEAPPRRPRSEPFPALGTCNPRRWQGPDAPMAD
eukprot:424348-Alexandrium_andersonii.AAC.1